VAPGSLPTDERTIPSGILSALVARLTAADVNKLPLSLQRNCKTASTKLNANYTTQLQQIFDLRRQMPQV
jgi:hypothetical protein